MGVSKVEYGDRTLIDLTADTVTADTLLKGATAHNKAGERITGTKEFKTQTKAIAPSSSAQSITPDSSYDGLSQVTVEAIPASYIDTSDATADVYDIYNWTTAYVGGKKVTGAYAGKSVTVNISDADCSAEMLVIPCNWQPTFIAVTPYRDGFAQNKVVCCWGRSSNITYVSYPSCSVGLSTVELTTTYISSNVSNYWWWADGKLYIKRPNSTYSWNSKDYRVMAYR